MPPKNPLAKLSSIPKVRSVAKQTLGNILNGGKGIYKRDSVQQVKKNIKAAPGAIKKVLKSKPNPFKL